MTIRFRRSNSSVTRLNSFLSSLTFAQALTPYIGIPSWAVMLKYAIKDVAKRDATKTSRKYNPRNIRNRDQRKEHICSTQNHIHQEITLDRWLILHRVLFLLLFFNPYLYADICTITILPVSVPSGWSRNQPFQVKHFVV